MGFSPRKSSTKQMSCVVYLVVNSHYLVDIYKIYVSQKLTNFDRFLLPSIESASSELPLTPLTVVGMENVEDTILLLLNPNLLLHPSYYEKATIFSNHNLITDFIVFNVVKVSSSSNYLPGT